MGSRAMRAGARRKCSRSKTLCAGNAASLPARRPPGEKRESIRCRECDGDAFTAARACGFYEGALRASVLALKREPQVAPRLARLMFEAQQRAPINGANL